jgi:hypothetical protein
MMWKDDAITHNPLYMCDDVKTHDNIVVRDDSNVLNGICA